MRKKLLALLMCATMVLGTGVTAFAAPSADDYTAAEKVFTSNGKKITDEISTNSSNKKVTMSAYIDGEGSASYGFTGSHGNYVAVRLDSDGDALEYIGTVNVNLAKKGYAPADITANPSAVANKVISKLTSDLGADANIPSNYKVAQVVSTTIGKDTTYSLVVSTINSKAAVTTANVTAADISTVVYPTKEDISVDATGCLAADVDFITADGYSYKKSGASLMKADGRVTASNGAKYYYTLGTISSPTASQVKSVVMGVANGTISTNAAAVSVTLWQVYKDGNTLTLETDVKPSSDVTIKLDNDILSNTKLSKTTTSVYTISDTTAVDSEVGSYKVIAPIAGGQNVDFSKAYGTFEVTLPALSYDYVLIFDQGEDASQNDGVSDTDTTSTTTAAASNTAASSPKTGDVAPIAALAVVMMGACGAMVVASKRRA